MCAWHVITFGCYKFFTFLFVKLCRGCGFLVSGSWLVHYKDSFSHDLANIITSALFCDVILQILQDIISSIYTSVWFTVRRRTEGLCEAILHYLITLLLESIDLSGCG